MTNEKFPTRDLDTALLRAFISVVETGSFSRAADRLNRTQSTLSMQIKRLESLIGSKLLDRSNKPPTLTPSGERLIGYAKTLVAVNDAALDEVRSKEKSGLVRVAAMEDFGTSGLLSVITRFRETHPDVRVDVETGLTSELIKRLGRSFDIVIAMTRVGADDGELLYRGHTLWGAHVDFDPKQHVDLPVALYRQGCLFSHWATQALERSGRRWHTGLVSSSTKVAAAAVREGWCVSIFKDLTFPKNLCVIGPENGLPSLPNFEMRLFSSPNSRKSVSKNLADCIRNHFEQPS